MLGNIRFIGELGKLAVVHEGILHKCIQQLLEKKRGLSLTDQAEDLECLCQIMRTVGKRLDTSKAKLWMDQYFERMEAIQQSGEMPSRIRFMLQDVLEMRQNAWEPRHVAREMTPQTLGQIRKMMTPDRPSTEMAMSRGPKSAVNVGLVDIFGMPMMKKVSSAGSLTTMTTEAYNRPISPGPATRTPYTRPDSSTRMDYYDKERSDRDGAAVQRDYNTRGMEGRDGVRNRDQMPRLSNKSLATMGGDRLSLRPGSGLPPAFKPASPHQLPKSARSTSQSPIPAEPVREAPIFTKPPAVIIKQENRQKNKKQQQTSDSKSSSGQAAKPLSENAKCDKLVQVAESMWSGDDIEAKDMDGFCQLFRDLQLSKSSTSKLLTKLTSQVMKKNLDFLDQFSAFILQIISSGLVTAATLESVLHDQVTDVEHLELSHPDMREKLCRLIVSFLVSELIDLAAVCKVFEGGHGHPMALQLLGLLAKKNGIEWLKKQLSCHKISIINWIPSNLQKDEEIMNLLETYDISHLMPVLELQKQLWTQINADPNPTFLFKWIMKNMENMTQDDQFTRVLLKMLLKYISSNSTLKDDTDRTRLPDKALQERERALFAKYQDIMLRFLHGSQHQQMVALYSLQQFCYEYNFPKGMMLRAFTYLYDLEIIDEDVFLKWKEDINETYPGKGKALFEVNQWLTWLEQAESESEEEDDE